ncbi:MAG: UDP-2,3-diacylglucosamine diphosphatase [Halioglobus sp.]
MPSTVFISDLHLDSARPAVIQALAAFLEKNTHCDGLYILGDLFEVWLGDDDDSPIAQEVTRLLKQYSDSGPSLYLMQGNRDFLLGDDFCRAVGGQLLQDPVVVDLYGTPTLLMHGDSLCTDDAEYQAFRKTARDPKCQADLLSRSLDERKAFAAHLRSVSKESNSNKAQDIMDVSADEVAKVMAEHGVTRLIHGHTHRPAQHDLNSGVRWVLGDWEQYGWAIEVTSDNIELFKFHI